MRPRYRIPDVGTLREITIWKAIVFGILTFGIYLLVVTYQNSADLQNARERPFDAWELFFWVGLLVGPLHLVLWVLNYLGVEEIRDRTGQSGSSLGIAALILAVILPPVGQIIWAVHFNETIEAPGEPDGY